MEGGWDFRRWWYGVRIRNLGRRQPDGFRLRSAGRVFVRLPASDRSSGRRRSQEPRKRRSAPQTRRDSGNRVLRRADKVGKADPARGLDRRHHHGDRFQLRRHEYHVRRSRLPWARNRHSAGDWILTAQHPDFVCSRISAAVIDWGHDRHHSDVAIQRHDHGNIEPGHVQRGGFQLAHDTGGCSDRDLLCRTDGLAWRAGAGLACRPPGHHRRLAQLSSRQLGIGIVRNFIVAIDTKHDDLQGLRIDRSQGTSGEGEPPVWARRYILAGIALLVMLGVSALAYRLLSPAVPEVEVTRATAETGGVAGTVLSASGYIVAHHKINVNSKVTGRVAWIGVEKGDKVKEGQVVVRLEDQEFRALYEQARGGYESAKARLAEMEHGSRPEEIQQAEHNLSEARATAANDKTTLDRTRDLFSQGVVSKQALDDATARNDSSQQRVNSLEQMFRMSKIGPRAEQIQRARGDLGQAQGQMDYAKSQLDATVIRAPVSGTILERTAEK